MKSMDLTDKNCILALVNGRFWETGDILWYYNYGNGLFSISDKLKKVCRLDAEFCIDSVDKLFSITVQRDQPRLKKAFQNLYLGLADSINTEIRLTCGNGSIKSFLLKGKRNSVETVGEKGSTIITGTVTDIQESRKCEAALNYVKYYDSVTGLMNRHMFTYKTNSLLGQGNSSPDTTAVLCISIDNLRQVNDLYGHMSGDEAIREASRSIYSVLDRGNILSRSGNDEFLVLLQYSSPEVLLKRIRKIQRAIYKTDRINDIEVLLTSSAGAAIFPEDGDCAEELIRNAHTAMNKAKGEGSSKFCFYDKHIKDEIENSMKLEKNLRNAIKNGEFYLEYQPLVDYNTGLIAGVEALIRWESPIYGQVQPLDFIPAAEKTGLILKIGYWVLEQACSQCKSWIDSYGIQFPVSVNISALQLKSEGFFDAVISAVAKAGIPAEQLQLEITESTLLDDFDKSAELLKKLRQKGIKIALDDFGTGFSSLNYLKNLPLDTLKIDKSFIKGLSDGERDTAITGTIIALAHILKLEVIAEGVETKEQAVHLKSMNCNLMQGYYFSKAKRPEYLEPFFGKESITYDKSACSR